MLLEKDPGCILVIERYWIWFTSYGLQEIVDNSIDEEL